MLCPSVGHSNKITVTVLIYGVLCSVQQSMSTVHGNMEQVVRFSPAAFKAFELQLTW